jgi:nicotinamidase-related amidase
VRHNDGRGEKLEYGTDGWQIYNGISPNKEEKIFEKKYNSAFFKTDLKEYLDAKKIGTIILTGLQTEYCIDATLKSAFDNEYLSGEKLYEFYNYEIWNNRFAKVLSVEEASKFLLENR